MSRVEDGCCHQPKTVAEKISDLRAAAADARRQGHAHLADVMEAEASALDSADVGPRERRTRHHLDAAD